MNDDRLGRTASGLFVPKGTDDPGTYGEVLSQRELAAMAEDIRLGIAWAEQWPKVGKGEKPLARGDVLDMILARARAWLWPRPYTEAVFTGVLAGLGMVATPPKPPTEAQSRAARRQALRLQNAQRRAQGKPTLEGLPQPLPPLEPTPADPVEAGHGFTEGAAMRQPQATDDETTRNGPPRERDTYVQPSSDC